MKKIFSKQLIKVISLSFIICHLSFSPVAAQKTLTILHTNDTHSTVMPLNKNLADTLLADRGGFLRRMTMVEQERQQDPDLLLFDSGDFSQGSAYYSIFKGDVEVGLMNQMRYDAATIGNHEFDFGLENMIRIFKMCEFPIVCSNYDFGDTELKDIVKSYIIIKRKGIKIGVFGLCPKLDGLVFTKNYGPLVYLDPIAKAQEMVNLLKNKKKCDYVICLSHLGWAKGECPDERVIENTQGIDLVLGGHSHTYLEKLEYVNDQSGRAVPVDQNGKHGAFIGKLQLTFNKR